MACNKCYNHSCNGSCGQPEITRQVRIENNSIGRDGESAYEAYIRLGGTLSEEEWAFDLDNKVDLEEGKSLIDNDLIIKVSQDYTRNEIDTKINTAINQSQGAPIDVIGTVLPQGVNIPSSVTLIGTAWLLGDVGGTTYTQTGGSSISVTEGYMRQAFYNKDLDLWEAGNEVPLPIQDVSNLATKQELEGVDIDVEMMLDGFYDIQKTFPTKPFVAGYINIFGTTSSETGSTWRRTTANYSTGNLFARQEGHRYYYTGVIEAPLNPALPPAGVAYYSDTGVFLGYECSEINVYSNFRLSPPAGTAWIGASSKGSDPIITDEVLTPRQSTAIIVDATSPAGGDGSVAKPFNTISEGLAKLATNGIGLKKLIIYQGDYRETLDLALLSSGDYEIAAREGHKVRVLGSNKLSGWTKTSGRTNVYQLAYGATIPAWTTRNSPIFEDGRPSLPIDQNEAHPLQKNLSHYLPFTPIYEVGDIDTVDAIPGTYCRISGIVYLHTSDSNDPNTNGFSYESITSRPSNTFNLPATTSKKVNIIMTNIQFFYTVGGFVIAGFNKFKGIGISAFGTTAAGLIRSDSGDTELWFCEAAFGDVDGFNDHFNRFTGYNSLSDNRSNYPTAKYYGCWGHHNGDDGQSSHEQHNIFMDTCLFEHNGDSGCRGSNDATYLIKNTIFRDNGWQVGHGGDAGKGEGFAVVNTSLNPNRLGCRAILFNCVSERNNTGYGIVNNSNSRITIIDSVSRNNTTAEYYAGAGLMTVENSKATNLDPIKKKVISGTGVVNVINDDNLV